MQTKQTIRARRIDPKLLPDEKFYEETCKDCSLRFNDLPYSRTVYIGNQEVRIKTNYHEECASCFAKFLAELYKKREVFYIV